MATPILRKLALRALEDRLHVLVPRAALFPGPSGIVASPTFSLSSAIPFAIASPIERLGHAAPLSRSSPYNAKDEDSADSIYIRITAYNRGPDSADLVLEQLVLGRPLHLAPPRRIHPLYATLTLEPSVVNRLPGFKKRMNWFLENGPELVVVEGASYALASKDSLIRILKKMLDESEFFSDTASDRGRRDPAPDHPFFGRDIHGHRALNGGNKKLDLNPFFRDYVRFYEYFHDHHRCRVTPPLTLARAVRCPRQQQQHHTLHSASKQPRTRTPGMYDGRETDAWALGVVLFTLATRAPPFDPPARRRWVLRVVRGE
ncbi:hypothetical protein EDB89DRAFT_2065456 [Lactarius sanguifluus]|nr:hypothetical protein EDB89DRAFT_2065456 [Lactarius sanguifluus]